MDFTIGIGRLRTFQNSFNATDCNIDAAEGDATPKIMMATLFFLNPFPLGIFSYCAAAAIVPF